MFAALSIFMTLAGGSLLSASPSGEIQEASYGYWKSPITPEKVFEESRRISDLQIDEEFVYWTELRPSEGGRQTIVRCGKGGEVEEMLHPSFNARTRVHEYGGAPYIVHHGRLYFVNFEDQQLYQSRGAMAKARKITEGAPRFAQMSPCPEGFLAVAESHEEEEVKNFLALVDPSTGKWTCLQEGYDFYDNPSLSPDGRKIVWRCWNHPNMSWDEAEIWVGRYQEGKILSPQKVAGGEGISVLQPKWSPEGDLHFLSEEGNGYWNLYRLKKDGSHEVVVEMEEEVGEPDWGLGNSHYGFLRDGRILFSHHKGGRTRLSLLSVSGKVTPLRALNQQGWDFSQLRVGNGFSAFLMGAPTREHTVMRMDLKTFAYYPVDEREGEIPAEYFSIPQRISFPTSHGDEAYAWYYPPTNPDFRAPQGEKPPVVVKVHGGPTSETSVVHRMELQVLASRGIAVVDVDYRGSSGEGRVYRHRLDGNWGIFDREDCEAAVRYLVEKGLVDGRKTGITGGSAGGFTTLGALCFGNSFYVGASLYGVADLRLLTKHTHKFESRYLDRLVGPLPEADHIYEERSAVCHPEKFDCPVAFFQGDEDAIVPKEQAEVMVQALMEKEIPVLYKLYEGEQHGFRKKENQIDCLNEMIGFFLHTWSAS